MITTHERDEFTGLLLVVSPFFISGVAGAMPGATHTSYFN
jgi:hypothetical protein